jgi:hypothetical protein
MSLSNSYKGQTVRNGEYHILFAEDFTANALLQVRVYWINTDKIHEKPFLVLVSAAPQAPAGKGGTKTYLLERPYGISMKFSVDELAALGFALDRIASGVAEHYGIDNTWTKWADPSKAKNGNGGIGKKMLQVAPVRKNTDRTKRAINLSFFCMLDAGTPDPRGILMNCKRDAQGIKYGVTVNLGAYQAMSAAMNLLSLADKLTEIDRRYRMNRFRAAYGQACEGRGTRSKRDEAEVAGSSIENRRLRLHQNVRAVERAEGLACARPDVHADGLVQCGGQQAADGRQPQTGENAGSRNSDPVAAQPLQSGRQAAAYGARKADFEPHPTRPVVS